MNYAELVDLCRVRRKRLGIKTSELSKIIGVHRQTIWNFEQMNYHIDAEKFVLLLQVLGIEFVPRNTFNLSLTPSWELTNGNKESRFCDAMVYLPSGSEQGLRD